MTETQSETEKDVIVSTWITKPDILQNKGNLLYEAVVNPDFTGIITAYINDVKVKQVKFTWRKLWGNRYILEIDPEYSLNTSAIIIYDSETDTISNISLSWINLYNDEEKPCERKIPIWYRKL